MIAEDGGLLVSLQLSVACVGVMYVCTVRSNYCTISVGQVDYFPVVVRRGEDRR